MDDPYVNTAGTTRDLHNPETKIPTVIGVSVFMVVLATTTVAARLYTRLRILRVTGSDDWLVLIGWALIVGHGITQCVMTRANLGRHVGFMTGPEDFTIFLKMFYASLIMYNGALMAIKLAFLAQYYRIMAGGGALKRALIIISCMIGLWSTSQMVIVIFQCQPVYGFWAPTPDTTCVPSLPGLYISAAGNIASDLVIVALPLPLIRGLHLPFAQKLVLSFVFCLGLVTTAISLLRLKYLKVSPDVTWDIADSNLCSLAEISSGIACACVPTLKPLAAQLFPKLFSTLRTQFADLRAPTPEWKPRRNLKEMLKDDGGTDNGGSVQGLPLAYLSLESLNKLMPLQMNEQQRASPSSYADEYYKSYEKRSHGLLTPPEFPPHPAVMRSASSSKRTSTQTTHTQATATTRSNGHRGNTVEIGATAKESIRAFRDRESRRISQSSSSIYVRREVTVEVEDDWA